MIKEAKWISKPYNEEKAEKLHKELGTTKLIARLLVSRGIDNKEQAVRFLKPNFKEGLYSPSLLKDIDKVKKRILKAIEKNEKILIHGDYDADGVTTIAVYVKAFEKLGVNVDYFVPNRFTDGYGVNMKNVEEFAKYDLIITGDTGIKAFDAIYELTNVHGKDVIVTDHHEPVIYPASEKERIHQKAKIIEKGEFVMGLPDCYGVINPKRMDCDYPNKDLSGAGVAFKVMEAVYEEMNSPKKDLYYLLDIVACGLIPDLVRIFDAKENNFETRNLIKIGLGLMNKEPKSWVTAVKDIKGKADEITSTDIAFTYGPMLNAAGRLYDPKIAVQFLLEKESRQVNELAQKLHEINEERKKITEEIAADILEKLGQREEYGLVVTSEDLNIGITGLVASKVLNAYYRPTIALAPIWDDSGNIAMYKGSARSIEGIHILNALIDVERWMGPYEYGGHEQAAGLVLLPEQLETFRELFQKAVKKQADEVGYEVFEPRKFFDITVSLDEIDLNIIYELNRFEPFGMGNENPLFYIPKLRVENIRLLRNKTTMDEKGIKFYLSQNGQRIEGVIFQKVKEIQGEYVKRLMENYIVECDILAYPRLNPLFGKLELMIEDIRFV